jgi:hypothetical protein
MNKNRSSVFGRLRACKLLPAWLLVLALASALAGMHVASHVGTLSAGVSIDLAPAGEDDDPGPTRHGDCPVCRLAGIWSLALPVVVLLALLAPAVARLLAVLRGDDCRHDVAARWRLRRKQGPPLFSR